MGLGGLPPCTGDLSKAANDRSLIYSSRPSGRRAIQAVMPLDISVLAVSVPCGSHVFMKRDGRNEGISLLVALTLAFRLIDALLRSGRNVYSEVELGDEIRSETGDLQLQL